MVGFVVLNFLGLLVTGFFLWVASNPTSGKVQDSD